MYGGSNPPGTSEKVNMPDTEMCSAFIFIDIQLINYLLFCVTSCAGVDRCQFLPAKGTIVAHGNDKYISEKIRKRANIWSRLGVFLYQ